MMKPRVPRPDVLAVGLIVFVCLVTFAPVWVDFMHGHDVWSHLAWNWEFLDSLRAGPLYPRWMRDFNQGDGSPTFLFRGPVFSYAVAVLSAGSNVLTGMRLATLVAWIGTGLGVYYSARHWFSPLPSVIASLAYIGFPYHAYDLFERAALAELVVFAIPPLIAVSLLKLKSHPQFGVAGLSACIAFSIVTHLVSAIMFLYVIAAFTFVGFFMARRQAILSVCGIVLGIALSAVYLLPAYGELTFLDRSFYDGPIWNFRNNFLFRPGETPGRAEALLQIRLQAFALAPIILAGFIGVALGSRKQRDELAKALVWPSIGAGALFMATPASLPVWWLPGLEYLVEPWRWMLIATFGAAMTLAALWTSTPRRILLTPVVILFLANAAIAGSYWITRAYQASNDQHGWMSNPSVLAVEQFRSDLTFPPRWIPNPRGRLIESDLAQSYETAVQDPRVMIDPSGSADVTRWEPEDRAFRVSTPTPGTVRLRTFYFPGWRCVAETGNLDVQPGPDGRISFNVSSGVHEINCHFGSTPVRRAGLLVSLASSLVLAGTILVGIRSKP